MDSAIQLYSLRNVEQPLDAILEAVADAGFSGVEFAYRVVDEDAEAIAKTLEETGLSVAGAHVRIDPLEAEFEETVAFYETLGCESFVIPAMDEEYFASREGIQEAIDRLEPIAEQLTERGLSLHYHNHTHEYTQLDGTTGFDVFIEQSDIGIQVDGGLALLAGDDPVERVRSLGDRARLAHLKDVDTESGTSVPVGTGDLDVEAFSAAFREVGGEWLIYEYEGGDPLASLSEDADRVNALCRGEPL